MLPDREGQRFAPRLQIGLDVSSMRRLRIPIAQIESHIKTDVSLFQQDELLFLEPFLSRRIFESSEQALFIAFRKSGKCIALLLELDGEAEDNFPVLEAFPQPLLIETTDFLMRSRKKLSGSVQNTCSEASQLMQRTERTINQAKNEGKHLLFLILDLSPLLDALTEISPSLDRFTLAEDLRGGLSLLTTDQGFCAEGKDDYTIMALISKKAHSRSVLVHQINNLLKREWFGGREIPPLKIFSRTWPEDGKQAEELLADFILKRK
ncbi:MAG TPA: hypothetical protein ENN41_07335 [Sediminispirochaeta sp.]|nr:hypothetical protein [Sediminispirochaeta sp.]